MGVVQNKIEIGFLAEANARVMASVKKISNNLTPEVITLTPYDDTITIQEQDVHRIGNIVTGYVRFTVSSENTSTGDYAVLKYPADIKPAAISRAYAYSTWDASKKGIVNIQTNGSLAVAANSFMKGQAYCINFTWVIA